MSAIELVEGMRGGESGEGIQERLAGLMEKLDKIENDEYLATLKALNAIRGKKKSEKHEKQVKQESPVEETKAEQDQLQPFTVTLSQMEQSIITTGPRLKIEETVKDKPKPPLGIEKFFVKR